MLNLRLVVAGYWTMKETPYPTVLVIHCHKIFTMASEILRLIEGNKKRPHPIRSHNAGANV